MAKIRFTQRDITVMRCYLNSPLLILTIKIFQRIPLNSAACYIAKLIYRIGMSHYTPFAYILAYLPIGADTSLKLSPVLLSSMCLPMHRSLLQVILTIGVCAVDGFLPSVYMCMRCLSIIQVMLRAAFPPGCLCYG